jgi:hypothetical protein
MKRMLSACVFAAALAVGGAGSVAAHQIHISPLGQGSGTSVVAGGGPAHCNAAAPERATAASPAVTFDPPHAEDNC